LRLILYHWFFSFGTGSIRVLSEMQNGIVLINEMKYMKFVGEGDEIFSK
jgi:hypothetical protein